MTRLIFSETEWCVYTHATNDVVFYVGKGVSDRPFHQSSRTQKWKEAVGDKGVYDVKVVSWHPDERSALQAEIDLIEKLKPACNVSRGSLHTRAGATTMARTRATFFLPPPVCDRAAALARRRGRSNIGDIMRQALERFLDVEEPKFKLQQEKPA